MYPLSFSEFMSVYQGDKYEGLSEYMLYGGIPLVVLREGADADILLLDERFNIQFVFARGRELLRMGELTFLPKFSR